MEVKLVVIGGKHSGRAIPVTRPKFVVGRADDCHLRTQSDLVSRHHAAILVEDGRVAVRDFGSKNGTFVNDRPVEDEQELQTGDRLKIGSLEFDVQLTVSVGGKKKSKVQSIHEAATRTVEVADDELDISGWLADEGDSPTTVGSADTQPFTASPTAAGGVPTDAAPPSQKSTEQPEAQQDKKNAKPAKSSGPLRAARKPMAESSGSAADETLRQLFSRKR